MAACEYHVATTGDDSSDGTPADPLRTVSAAAQRAGPGDEVVVHEGTYRERVDPPRAGTATDPIVYRGADGADVVLTGADPVSGWESVADGVWRTAVPNERFGEYNPYADRIRGDWFDDRDRDHHTGGVYIDGRPVPEAPNRDDIDDADAAGGWHATVGRERTTIHAAFGGDDPRETPVEINVRPAVFYPSRPSVDHLEVRGFTMRCAATQWAPPTTEQIGLLGTHWSRGWVIEDNEIAHSRCVGITLGKYGQSVDATGATADRYNRTIREARAHGWQRGSVGHHRVRNNEIHHCGQAGIVGSLGGAFSEISENHIHDINLHVPFRGAEIAGIKLHGPIDATIRGNRVHRTRRGIWLDWMAQGSRVTRNVLYENARDDLFVEVSHGPYVVDTNVLLSDVAIRNWSQGGAYAHNLIGGDVVRRQERDRSTPYLRPRSTEIAGLAAIEGGDDRVLNNVFAGGSGLSGYDDVERAVVIADNLYAGSTEPSRHDSSHATVPRIDCDLHETDEEVRLDVTVEGAPAELVTEPVTTQTLPSAVVPDAPFTDPDGTTLRIDHSYEGDERPEAPAPGPFVDFGGGHRSVVVWPL